MELNDLAQHIGEWLRGSGPESDIVISSRIRLARNLAEFPFISRASESDKVEIERQLRKRVGAIESQVPITYVDVSKLEEIDRQFLVERQLISREHAEREGARGVAIGDDEQFSVMINEEDHLRIQVMHSGLDLESAWEQISDLDDRIEQKVA
ncbi:MAG: ATP--guanido phosphotransferase, partial [Planctomycetales bacterium]|nr:ATP--guanido phosphotransferase [Planctomycetales bacterium]